MKWIITGIVTLILYPALLAQDTIITPATAEPVPVSEPVNEVQAAANSQPKQAPVKKDWKKKLYYGGYINFSLGSYTSLGIEPMLGYKILPFLSVGAKIRYDYVKDNRSSRSYSNYGGSLFSRLNLGKRIYLHAEYAGYNYELYQFDGGSDRQWVPFFFVGGGFRQPVGKRASLNAQVLFDVLHNKNSPYGSWEPFYSVGVSVGF